MVVVDYFGYLTLPGLVIASFWTLTEPLSFCLTLSGVYLWDKKNIPLSVVLFALACLSREVSVLVPAALCLHAIRNENLGLRKAFIIFLLITLPLLLWIVYVHVRLPVQYLQSYYSVVGPSTPEFGDSLFLDVNVIEGKYAWAHLTTHTELKRTLSVLFITSALLILCLTKIFDRKTKMGVSGTSQGIL